jgi:hypothetical protein
MDEHGIALGVCTNRTLPGFIRLIPPNLSIQHLQVLIKKGFWCIGESGDRVLYVSMAVVDKIEYCVVVLREGYSDL